jgi:hypothetical protein
MTIRQQVESFINEYGQKLQDLSTRLQDAVNQAEYLQMEIRFIQETELPEASAKAVLDGTDDSHVVKLKKQLQKYQEQLQTSLEKQLILQQAIKQYQYQSGEKLVELDRLYRQEKSIQESKHYSKAMYYKKMYIDSLIEEGQKLKELNQLDTKLQQMLVDCGRKSGVYTDSAVKSSPTNSGNGTYLALSHQEVTRFVSGNHTASDYDYLRKHASLKDLG